MTRAALIVTIPTTTLGLLFVAVHSIFLDDGPAPWKALKALVCAILLITNVVSASLIFLPASSRPTPRLAAISAAVQIALGALAFAWTFHLADSTGDFEGGIATLATLVAFQGLATLSYVVPAKRPTLESS